jgi:predicted ATPase/DNA-binding CsgD family transcriptional regulator
VPVTGRRDELAAVRRSLSGSERLITLTGPGGIGKTWLARLALEEVGRAFPDGTHVVEVSDVAEARLLVRTVADRMGLRLDAGDSDASVLVPLTADRHALLLLDGCEHLLSDCARLVAGLLRGCPGLHVLTTSRLPLGVTGEHVVSLPPLAVPGDSTTVDPLTALTCDAVALFVERATAVLPTFRLTEDNAEAVAAICARLDGNPLAIELAAARTGVLAPEAILARLEDRYRLLTRGPRDAVPQLPSLRASVDASWELCTEPQRLLWARLSVFPADFELDAVEDVCSGDGIADVEVLDVVDSLLEQSVLVRDADPRAVRYRLPESLRCYGAERLGPDGRRRWSERHLAWTEGLVLTTGREWFGPRQTSRLGRLRREQVNVLAALDRATEDPALASRALQMIQALEPWWVVTSRVTEARHWLAAALHHRTGAPDLRARALALGAWFATVQGDLLEAERLLDEASRLREVTSPEALSSLARARGGLSVARGDVEAAEASFQHTVEHAVRSGNQAVTAEGWLLLGLARDLVGRDDDAELALRRCLALADRAGESQLRASALALQALRALRRDHVSTALRLAREGLRTKVAAGDWFGAAILLEVLAWVALADDDPARTAILLGAAEGAWRRAGVTPPSMGPLAAARDGRLAAAQAALGRREFQRYAARGAALAWKEAVRYAEDDLLPRQRRTGSSAPLTSRELAVAELVARGMSNPEIAAALVISVRTVQGHVEKILRKLGFGSRAQVAAWVAQRGVDQAP